MNWPIFELLHETWDAFLGDGKHTGQQPLPANVWRTWFLSAVCKSNIIVTGILVLVPVCQSTFVVIFIA